MSDTSQQAARVAETIYSNCLQGLSMWNTKRRNAQLIERYQHLIQVMEGLTPHQKRRHFSMENWGEKTECGTSMCAAGFCGTDRWFKRRGFKFVRPEHNGDDYSVSYGNAWGWDAIERFFGVLPSEEDDWSGVPRHQVFHLPETAAQVIRAAKIRIKILEAQS